MKMDDEHIYILISKHLAGETSEEEDMRLWEWIDKNPDHLKLFQELVGIYAGKSTWVKKLSIEKKDFSTFGVKEKRTWTKNLWRIAAAVVLGTSIAIYL